MNIHTEEMHRTRYVHGQVHHSASTSMCSTWRLSEHFGDFYEGFIT